MAETSYSTMTSTSTHMQASSAQIQGGSAHMQISSAHMQTGTTHMQTGSTHMQADSAHMQVEQQWQGSYGVQQLASLPEVRGAWRSTEIRNQPLIPAAPPLLLLIQLPHHNMKSTSI